MNVYASGVRMVSKKNTGDLYWFRPRNSLRPVREESYVLSCTEVLVVGVTSECERGRGSQVSDMRGIDLLASPSVGATCHGHALTCMPLFHEGGQCVRPGFHGEGVRWHSCRHPHCCRGMDIVVVE
jgi:hypothetical protein